MNELLGGAIPLLGDPSLEVIKAYRMEHSMGAETIGSMGYVIIDRQGVVRKIAIDPSFGQHSETILQELRAL